MSVIPSRSIDEVFAADNASPQLTVSEPSIKSALLKMRRDPSLQTLAEGWIAILKNDPKRASQNFESMESIDPLLAKLGKGVSELLQGQYAKANATLQQFRHFSGRLPVLSKLMGWNQQSEQQLANLFSHGTLASLKQAVRDPKLQQHPLKPWLYLRLGDLHFYERNFREALNAWEQADCDPLVVDLEKRLALLQLEISNGEEWPSTAYEFYTKLKQRNPKEAREFLETMILSNLQNIDIYSLGGIFLDHILFPKVETIEVTFLLMLTLVNQVKVIKKRTFPFFEPMTNKEIKADL